MKGCEKQGGGMEEYRQIEIRRPQYPWILKWVDPEFKVIYINKDAHPDAKIIHLMADDEDDADDERGRG